MIGVYFTETVHGTAVLDTRTGAGQWRILDPVSTQLWNLIIDGIPSSTAVDAVAARWAVHGNSATEVHADLTRIASEFSRTRLPGPAVRTPSLSHRSHICTATTGTGRTRDRIAAYAGLALALVLLRCAPVRWVIAVAQTLVRLPGRPSTVAQAQTAHAAVRHAARLWPGRAACLEESLGAYFALAFTGHQVRWVLGMAFIPQSPHAWIETSSTTVIGQAEEDRVWPYVPVLRIGISD